MKIFCSIPLIGLKAKDMKNLKNNKPYVIAEIAQGFEGQPFLCKKFVQLAKKVGAHAVKFQIFEAEELCTKDYPYHGFFKSLEISESQWLEIINEAKRLEIDFMADVFGTKTLSWLKNSGAAGIKIHGTDVKNFELIRAAAEFPGVVCVSTGGSELSEVRKAAELIPSDRLVLVSGFQAEPNQLGDVELEKLSILKNEFNCAIGYADHIDAKDPLAVSLPVMASLKGANVIEKHLTVERDFLQLEDYVSALNPNEFIAMVDLLNKASAFPVQNKFELSEREKAYRQRSKKVPVLKVDLKPGTRLEPQHIELLRVQNPPVEIKEASVFIGKVLNREASRHEVISDIMF